MDADRSELFDSSKLRKSPGSSDYGLHRPPSQFTAVFDQHDFVLRRSAFPFPAGPFSISTSIFRPTSDRCFFSSVSFSSCSNRTRRRSFSSSDIWSREIPRRGGSRPFRVSCDVSHVELKIGHQMDRVHELRLGLAGKSDDDIRVDGDVRDAIPDFIHEPAILVNRVAAPHVGEHQIVAGLQGDFDGQTFSSEAMASGAYP